jgi:hypothetical protein
MFQNGILVAITAVPISAAPRNKQPMNAAAGPWGQRPRARSARFLPMLLPLAGGRGTVVKFGEFIMILELHRQGLKVAAIARQLGIDRKTVRRTGAGLVTGITRGAGAGLVAGTPEDPPPLAALAGGYCWSGSIIQITRGRGSFS